MEILERTTKGYHDPVLWAWLEIVFTPKRYIPAFQNKILSLVIVMFLLISLKGTVNAPFWDLLRLIYRYQNRLFTGLKRYGKHAPPSPGA